KHALLDPLEPHARAYAVTPFRHAQSFDPVINGVLAVGRREGRRLGGGRPASNDQGARIASVSSLQKEQASKESSPAAPVRWVQWRWCRRLSAPGTLHKFRRRTFYPGRW